MDKIPLRQKYVQNDAFLNTLADAYRLQESIINTTELSIISTTPEGLITSFNTAAERMTGYTAEEMIGRATPLVLHDNIQLIERAGELSNELGIEVEPNFEVLSAKTRFKKVADRREWTYIRKDGSRLPVSLSVTSLWDEKGTLTGFAGIATDISDTKAAEKKIRDSEAHLQALLNSIDDIAYEVDRNGVYTNVWTRKDYLLFINPREEYLGKKLGDVLTGDLLELIGNAVEKVFHTHQSQYVEYPVPHKDRWSSCKISYINDDKVVMLVRDITAKKKAELHLAQSEQKFRALAENIPGAIYLCRNDESFSMLYLNDQVLEITGYTADEFLTGRVNFVMLYHPDDKAYIFDTVETALKHGRRFQLKYRLRDAKGDWHWVEEIGMGIVAADGSQHIEGFIRDITAQQQVEESLQKIADENNKLFNNAINLVVLAGFDGYFKKVNPHCTRVLGWSDEELRARPFQEFVHPDDAEATTAAVKYITQGNNLATFENRYRTKDGTYRWLLWSSATDVKNGLIYASAVDITERKKSEDELLRSKQNMESFARKLQEQNRQLDEFAHIISHNLRSPIGNIKALIRLLNNNSTIDEYRVIFEKLTNVANNLGETMSELMETLKAKKETDIERSEIRFAEVLEKVMQTLEGEILQTGATITHDFSKRPTIHYSKSYLESIFQNLLTNAIKYRSPDRAPHIHISTDTVDGAIEMRTHDNGLGFDMSTVGDKLFGLHKTFHHNNDARGVGLFLIKTQIEALGGSIRAESKVGDGATFIVNFGEANA